MPLFLNIVLSFVVGVLWVERLRPRAYLLDHFLSWPLVAQVVFQGIVLTPLQIFLFRFNHDWSLGYLIDPELHHALDEYLTLWSLLAALAPVGSALVGHFVGRIKIEKPKSRAITMALTGAGALALLYVVLLARELGYVGDFEAFHSGEARFWLLSWAGLLGLVEIGASVAFLLYGPRLMALIPRESSHLV